jgi:hypothetical protein
MNTRSEQRKQLFTTAFQSMPLWETWTEKHIRNGEEKERGNFRAISRSTRRDMARQLARRQWQVRKGTIR